jgi:hypothetical protein
VNSKHIAAILAIGRMGHGGSVITVVPDLPEFIHQINNYFSGRNSIVRLFLLHTQISNYFQLVSSYHEGHDKSLVGNDLRAPFLSETGSGLKKSRSTIQSVLYQVHPPAGIKARSPPSPSGNTPGEKNHYGSQVSIGFPGIFAGLCFSEKME